eukprot:3785070-Lingulodinium_polyedra.AAC.1
MKRANVPLASRCCVGRSIRPPRCATFAKCYATMRSNRPRAIVTARKSHARALHAHNNFCCMHGVRERAICGGG